LTEPSKAGAESFNAQARVVASDGGSINDAVTGRRRRLANVSVDLAFRL
jgi:hypothetical protein